MEIAAFRVEHIAEQTLLDDVQHQHLGPIVVAVLHHHGVTAEFFGGLHKRPAVVDGHRRGDLGRGMRA
ncbi:MAG: hypothetical protein K2Y23_01905 [Cyanobacteria bacterium]|nr:hypothetical protein [Cyanobacteriota bacterium]